MSWNLEEAISYYQKLGAPRDQSALIELLREVQLKNGGAIPSDILPAIAASYAVKESLLLAVIKRIPSLRLGNTHCLELCAGPNCGKQAVLAKYAETLHAASGKRFQLKFVPCMRMCGKGPNIRWNGTVYHKADEALLRKLLKDARINFNAQP